MSLFFGLSEEVKLSYVLLVKIGRFKTALTRLEFEKSSVDLDLFEHFFIGQPGAERLLNNWTNSQFFRITKLKIQLPFHLKVKGK